jgi:nitrite reductase/ring-hydroxylating ferredoxin subunit
MSTTMTEHRLCHVDDIPVGEGRAYPVGDDQVSVFRLRDGRLRALSAVCPHAGGPIADGQIDNHVVICPLHQHVYELDTGHCRTGQPPLRTYPVRVDDTGHVLLTSPPPRTFMRGSRPGVSADTEADCG